MNSQQDVGIGVCAAYYLAKEGIEVTLIEKGEIASGCSYGNGGTNCAKSFHSAGSSVLCWLVGMGKCCAPKSPKKQQLSSPPRSSDWYSKNTSPNRCNYLAFPFGQAHG